MPALRLSRPPARRAPRALPILAAALAALGALAACDDGAASEPPPTVAALRAQVAADSAAGDSAALATLPPVLQEVLRLEPFLDDAYIARTPDAECLMLGDSLPDVLVAERRRVRLRTPDSAAVVVFVRADRAGATLRRVEVVRRALAGEQVGFVWDGSADLTTEVRWPSGVRGRNESARQPRGGPVPRSLRALGRRVLELRCEDASEDRLPPAPPLTAVP